MRGDLIANARPSFVCSTIIRAGRVAYCGPPAASFAFLVTLVLARRLQEPEAAGMEVLLREMLIDSPQRFLVRLWSRE